MQHIMVHLSLWFGILVLWIALSRNNHPTLVLNVVASFALVGVSAVAVYTTRGVLARRYQQHHSKVRYAAEMLLLVAVLDLVAVLTIQAAYDALWGPDPARFGFWTNVALEAVFIGLHLAAAYTLAAVWRYWKREEGQLAPPR